MRSIELEAAPEAAARARHWLAESLDPSTARGVEVALLVTEIVGNALRHGDTPEGETLCLSVEDRVGHVRVTMSYPSDPLPEEPTKGFGFELLDRLAKRWGHDHDGDRLAVWFEMRKPGAAAAIAGADDLELLERARSDPEARTEVFHRFAGLATQLARRYRGKGIDADDLDQVAAMGLMKAIQRFDPAAGAFAAYASATISGEMKRHLRDRAWSVRVPRGLQEAALRVSSVESRLTQRLGRAPTVEEIAAETGLDEETVLEARRAGSVYRAASLDAPIRSSSVESIKLSDRIGSEDVSLELAERWQSIEPALRRLPERLRKILYLRFYEDKTQTEIAAIVGCSQMHVSRLLTQAIERLRDLVEEG